MIQTKYTVVSDFDRLPLSVIRIEPDDLKSAKGIIQLVHGMNEHKERYIPFMEFLASNGYITVIHDNRGHGESVKSPEDLGYMYDEGYAGLIEDAHTITGDIKRYALEATGKNDLPFILLGHSMGSMVVRCYVRSYDKEIDKLCVVGSPSKQMGMGIGLSLIKQAKRSKGERARVASIAKLVMGSYEKRFAKEGVPHSWINTDLEEVRKYNEDPFCNFCFTLNGFENLVKLTMLTYKNGGYKLENPLLPIRFFSGADDPCAIKEKSFRSAMDFLKKQGYSNVSGKWYEGMRHEILNEPAREKVYKDILEFAES